MAELGREKEITNIKKKLEKISSFLRRPWPQYVALRFRKSQTKPKRKKQTKKNEEIAKFRPDPNSSQTVVAVVAVVVVVVYDGLTDV